MPEIVGRGNAVLTQPELLERASSLRGTSASRGLQPPRIDPTTSTDLSLDHGHENRCTGNRTVGSNPTLSATRPINHNNINGS